MTLGSVIYNQIATWTAFAILAMFVNPGLPILQYRKGKEVAAILEAFRDGGFHGPAESG